MALAITFSTLTFNAREAEPVYPQIDTVLRTIQGTVDIVQSLGTPSPHYRYTAHLTTTARDLAVSLYLARTIADLTEGATPRGAARLWGFTSRAARTGGPMLWECEFDFKARS